jgi:hypothetical protein
MRRNGLKHDDVPDKAQKAVEEFVGLIHAGWRRKHKQAVSARQALRDLGVHIRFGKKWREQEPRMRVLTVCQPYAWALVSGPKRIENRTWPTSYRGPLVIHAGLSRDWMRDRMEDGTPVPVADLVFGAIVGVVDLVACVRPEEYRRTDFALPSEVYRRTDFAIPFTFDPRQLAFAEGPWCWVTANPRAIAPMPHRGAQGLWYLPWGVANAVLEAIE